MLDGLSDAADEVLDLFKKIHETKQTLSETDNTTADDTEKKAKPALETEKDLSRIFAFDSLGKLIRLSGLLSESVHSANALYKCEKENLYLLVLTKGTHTAGEFNRICNILSEYASARKVSQASHAYLEEHFVPLIADNALNSLAKMN